MKFKTSTTMEKPLDFVVNAYLPHERPVPRPARGSRTGQNTDGVDRLSALPDPLCQHIVSFLSATEARRTSFLSRRWRHVWCACPSFVFDEREFHDRPPPLLQWHTGRRNFFRFVDEALEARSTHFDDLNIDKFKISVRFVDEVSRHLERWITFALDRNVKELSVVAEMKDLIAIAEFFQPFRINVHINDSIFESIISGCPMLEKLNLSLVCGLDKIRITGEKLKMLVVFKCLPLEEVIVKAPNIESFLFRGKRQSPDKIDVSFCRRLKFLWLQRASNLTDDMLEQITCSNPNLEIMILSHCSNLRNATVCSPSLWMFVLFKCKNLISAKIHAPILRAFEYSGHVIKFSPVASSGQLDAIIHMDGHEICGGWYAKLKEMCTSFDICRTLWIRCERDVDLIVPQEMRKGLLPQLHGLAELKIHVRSGSKDLSRLEDGIRWIFPGLKNLYVESDGSTHHFQYSEGVGDVGPMWRRCRDFIRQERERF